MADTKDMAEIEVSAPVSADTEEQTRIGEVLLVVENLKTYFYLVSGIAKAVDGVSFTLSRGETLGVVGESGSGKSVMSKSLIRLLESNARIEDGSVLFEGRDVLKMDKKELRSLRGREVGMVFQDPMTSLDPVFKVGKQMIENLRVHRNMSKAEARETAINALREVGIPNPEARFESYPFELSGGMCQRVIIAMALCCDAKMIICDEPTTALDVTVQAQVLRLLKDLQREKGIGLIMITHNLGVVWDTCDKVMVMYAGKVVEAASVKTLYSNPLHPYTWGLLDSMPSLADERKTELATIPGMPPDLRLTGTCCNFYNRCPYAKPICEQEVPELIEIEPGHLVACHRQCAAEHLERVKGGAQ